MSKPIPTTAAAATTASAASSSSSSATTAVTPAAAATTATATAATTNTPSAGVRIFSLLLSEDMKEHFFRFLCEEDQHCDPALIGENTSNISAGNAFLLGVSNKEHRIGYAKDPMFLRRILFGKLVWQSRGRSPVFTGQERINHIVRFANRFLQPMQNLGDELLTFCQTFKPVICNKLTTMREYAAIAIPIHIRVRRGLAGCPPSMDAPDVPVTRLVLTYNFEGVLLEMFMSNSDPIHDGKRLVWPVWSDKICRDKPPTWTFYPVHAPILSNGANERVKEWTVIRTEDDFVSAFESKPREPTGGPLDFLLVAQLVVKEQRLARAEEDRKRNAEIQRRPREEEEQFAREIAEETQRREAEEQQQLALGFQRRLAEIIRERERKDDEEAARRGYKRKASPEEDDK